MVTENIEKHTMNSLSLALDLPYGTVYHAVRRGKILESYICDRGVYEIPPDGMRRLRRAANVANLYRVPFDRAMRIVADGFVPPLEKIGTQKGVA